MAEKDAERLLVEGIKKLGGKAYKFVSPGNAGVPDRLVVMPGGKISFVELKAEGGRVTLLQKRQLAQLKKLGCEASIVYGRAGVENFLAAAAAEKR